MDAKREREDYNRFASLPHSLAVRLNSVYDGLKSAERRAADHLVDASEDIRGVSISAFAQDAGCSQATIVRLSQRLGYAGFHELKQEVDSAGREEHFPYQDIDESDEPRSVLEKVIGSAVSGLTDTLELISLEEYDRAVEAISAAGRLLFCGVGDAGVVATEARIRFNRIGKYSSATPDPDEQLILAGQLRPSDVLVAISYSGRTKPVIEAVKEAKRSGATVIAVCNFPYSQVAKNADILLQTAAFLQYMNVEVISKRISQLCIVESLSISCLSRCKATAIRTLQKSTDIVRRNKVG
jgi:DNA-binding MurR/RpiR family transcriptional regulator